MTSFLIVLASVLATGASLVFLTYFATTSLIVASLVAILLWAPSNVAFVAALRRGVGAEKAYILFGVTMAITDTVAGIFLQGVVIKNLLFLSIASVTGLYLLYKNMAVKAEAPVLDKKRNEILCYVATVSLIVIGLLSGFWWVQTIAFAVADFCGAVLATRIGVWLTKFKLVKTGSFVSDVVSGTLGFVPTIVAVVILLQTLQVLPIVGPASGIASAALAIPAAALLFGRKIAWGKEFGWLLLASLSIVLIYYSYT